MLENFLLPRVVVIRFDRHKPVTDSPVDCMPFARETLFDSVAVEVFHDPFVSKTLFPFFQRDEFPSLIGRSKSLFSPFVTILFGSNPPLSLFYFQGPFFAKNMLLLVG